MLGLVGAAALLAEAGGRAGRARAGTGWASASCSVAGGGGGDGGADAAAAADAMGSDAGMGAGMGVAAGVGMLSEAFVRAVGLAAGGSTAVASTGWLGGVGALA